MSGGESRTALAARGSVYGLASKAVSLLVSFASRTVFIYVLGRYYLGVNGLYSDILSVLSFAELGFGSAMTFALYGPVARGEDELVRELLAFYRLAYRRIALVIAVAGLCVVPFLQHLVVGAESLSLPELRLYFVIFLANTVTSYFVSYKFGLVNALQRTYVRTTMETASSVACSVVQTAVLLVTGSFLAYLLANTATLVLSRVAIARWLDRSYPILAQRPARPLPAPERRRIMHEVRGLAVHQLSGVAVHATGSIVIALVPGLGVGVVGSVSNYTLIVSAVSSVMLILTESVAAGFGNLAAVETEERLRSVFDEANFVGFWLFGLAAVCMLVLLPPFIVLWVGEEYLIDSASLALILVDFYLQGQSSVYNNARIAKGEFNRDKWWSLFQAATNLAVAAALAPRIGLAGIYVGAVASRVVFVACRPLSTYRFLFGVSPCRYYLDVARYFLAVAAAGAACSAVAAPLLAQGGVPALAGALAVCLVVPNALFAALFSRSACFRSVLSRLAGLIPGGGAS